MRAAILARVRRLRIQGWMSIAAMPLCLLPAAVLGMLPPNVPTAVFVTALVVMIYALLLGIPLLLGTAIDALRVARRLRRYAEDGIAFERPAPAPEAPFKRVLLWVLVILHDLVFAYGGWRGCQSESFPWWLVGFLPLIIGANLMMIRDWTGRSFSLPGALSAD